MQDLGFKVPSERLKEWQIELATLALKDHYAMASPHPSNDSDQVIMNLERTSMIMVESVPKWQIWQNLQPNSILFNNACIPLCFDGQKHKFSNFSLFRGPYVSTGMTIRYAFWKNSDFDLQLYGLFLHPWKLNIHISTTHHLFDNNYNHEYVHLLYTVDASKIM